ncbi:hypothetical protein KIPB_008635 [Kipferlia bialata]|uniref:Uncharacterized protein n=1 Tax=Kipferlia bialata TaxID=797122 RepID=A0A391NND8_9EUKA|nr:hypothetical protein KIPB_008635 [Kipferlia bialata]|eukprot:g8635.t1
MTLVSDTGPDIEREDIRFPYEASPGMYGGTVEGWDDRKVRGIVESVPLPPERRSRYIGTPRLAVWESCLVCLLGYKLYVTPLDVIFWRPYPFQPWGSDCQAHLDMFVVDGCLLIVEIGGDGYIYVLEAGCRTYKCRFAFEDKYAKPLVGAVGNALHYIVGESHWSLTLAPNRGCALPRDYTIDTWPDLRVWCSRTAGENLVQLGRCLLCPDGKLLDTVSGDCLPGSDYGLYEQCGRKVDEFWSSVCGLSERYVPCSCVVEILLPIRIEKPTILTRSTALLARKYPREEVMCTDDDNWRFLMIRMDRPRPFDFYQHQIERQRSEAIARGETPWF